MGALKIMDVNGFEALVEHRDLYKIPRRGIMYLPTRDKGLIATPYNLDNPDDEIHSLFLFRRYLFDSARYYFEGKKIRLVEQVTYDTLVSYNGTSKITHRIMSLDINQGLNNCFGVYPSHGSVYRDGFIGEIPLKCLFDIFRYHS